jgi:Uma2 family endonuclease
MSTRTEATIEDLYKVEGKAELVNGEIVQMAPTGGLPCNAAFEIALSLRAYAKAKGGHGVGEGGTFIVNLPHRKSFCPDASYYIGQMTMKFFEGAPIFAVEVRSESDYGLKAERARLSKRADYFAAGTQVVWDVDLLSSNIVSKYHAEEPSKPEIFRRGELANAEPGVPGWSMLVDDLFPKRQ